MAGHIEIQR